MLNAAQLIGRILSITVGRISNKWKSAEKGLTGESHNNQLGSVNYCIIYMDYIYVSVGAKVDF